MATSGGTFKVQVLENGASIWEKEWMSEPSFDAIVSAVQVELGTRTEAVEG